MSSLSVSNLNFEIDKKPILKDISFEVEEGAFVGIIGANGSGKSTLLKNIYRLYKPSNGSIKVDGEDINSMNTKEIARKLAVLAQETHSEFDFNVEDIIKMGRYPYKSIFSDYSNDDFELVNSIIERMSLGDYRKRVFNSLSGGEKQRTYIARALVQDAKLLILDELTNHLDIGHQIQIMDMVKSLKITTLSAIHDMNLAAMYCDYIIVLEKGCVIKQGRTEEILTSDLIKKLFKIDCQVGKNPMNGKIHIFYSGIFN